MLLFYRRLDRGWVWQHWYWWLICKLWIVRQHTEQKGKYGLVLGPLQMTRPLQMPRSGPVCGVCCNCAIVFLQPRFHRGGTPQVKWESRIINSHYAQSWVDDRWVGGVILLAAGQHGRRLPQGLHVRDHVHRSQIARRAPADFPQEALGLRQVPHLQAGQSQVRCPVDLRVPENESRHKNARGSQVRVAPLQTPVTPVLWGFYPECPNGGGMGSQIIFFSLFHP